MALSCLVFPDQEKLWVGDSTILEELSYVHISHLFSAHGKIFLEVVKRCFIKSLLIAELVWGAKPLPTKVFFFVHEPIGVLKKSQLAMAAPIFSFQDSFGSRVDTYCKICFISFDLSNTCGVAIFLEPLLSQFYNVPPTSSTSSSATHFCASPI